jgi:Pectate lyase superfamily protein
MTCFCKKSPLGSDERRICKNENSISYNGRYSACTATAMAVTPGDLHTKNFGCAGNGTTDDTVNFQSAINAAMSSGSRLIIDPGTYLISAPLVISSPMTMLGAGHSKSIIKLASGTIDGIDVTSLSPVQLENFRVKGVSGATAGSLIKVAPSSVDAAYESFRDLSVENGFIAINMNNAILWSIDRCVIDSPASIGVLVQSLSNPDAGDSSISNTIFRISSTGSAIWQTSSGGLRVENNKILGGQHGYMLALNAAPLRPT